VISTVDHPLGFPTVGILKEIETKRPNVTRKWLATVKLQGDVFAKTPHFRFTVASNFLFTFGLSVSIQRGQYV
jgi:hypothetical protein